MKYFLYMSIISLLGISCVSKKDFYKRISYEYKNAQKNLYIVDTIKISSPLIITTKSNHRFICSEDIFKNYNGKESFFFKNQYVYIFQDGLPITMPSKVFRKYQTEFGGYKEILTDKKIREIASIYKFQGEAPIYFLLVLVQGDYYNSVYTGFHTPAGYYLGYDTFSYYRVALPLDNSTF